MVEGGGFEPPKAEPSDLQSDPFGRSGTPPNLADYCLAFEFDCQQRKRLSTKEFIAYVVVAWRFAIHPYKYSAFHPHLAPPRSLLTLDLLG